MGVQIEEKVLHRGTRTSLAFFDALVIPLQHGTKYAIDLPRIYISAHPKTFENFHKFLNYQKISIPAG
jgi:hypothetical protein